MGPKDLPQDVLQKLEEHYTKFIENKDIAPNPSRFLRGAIRNPMFLTEELLQQIHECKGFFPMEEYLTDQLKNTNLGKYL